MKFRYLFSIVLTSALVLAGCAKNEQEYLDTIRLSKTYLSIPATGGSVELTINANEDWEFVVNDNWPDVIKRDKEGKEESRTPSWLSAADKMSGGKGETKVTFSADEVAYGREIELSIKAGGYTQFLMVRQGTMTAETATCKDVMDGPDGKTYIVEGVCTSIANTTYGNWYLDDGTSEDPVYIYGTLDANGAAQNFLSLNIEVGDIVRVQGPKTTYNGTVELVDVTVLKLTKSLLKITENPGVKMEGGEFEIKVAYKGNGVFVDVPDESEWISYVGMGYSKGVPTKIEPNPCDTAIVKFRASENTGKVRKASVIFRSHQGDNSSEQSCEVLQLGNSKPISEVIAMDLNTADIDLIGTVMTDYNQCTNGFILADATGYIFIYEKSASIKKGDIVYVNGSLGAYQTGLQITGAKVTTVFGEKTVLPKDDDVAALDAAALQAIYDRSANSAPLYRKISGKAVLTSDNYKNLQIEIGGYTLTSYYGKADAFVDYDGKDVTAYGFVISKAASGDLKKVNMLVTSIKEK